MGPQPGCPAWQLCLAVVAAAAAACHRHAALWLCTLPGALAPALAPALDWACQLPSAHPPACLPLFPAAGSYCVYAVLNAAAALFLARHMVETKQQPVERIRALLMGEGN